MSLYAVLRPRAISGSRHCFDTKTKISRCAVARLTFVILTYLRVVKPPLNPSGPASNNLLMTFIWRSFS